MTTTTAAQRRAVAKTQFDAFLAACPSRKLLDRISDKWVVLILCALGGDGPYQPEAGNGGGPHPRALLATGPHAGRCQPEDA